MPDSLTQASFLEAFRQQFGEPSHLFRAPARTNIIGEHCDYNDGLVMPVNMALHTWCAIAPRDDRRVRIRALSYDGLAETGLNDIRRDPGSGWQEYPKGVLHVLQSHGYELHGADIMIGTNIPIGGGLSSSASLETVVGMAALTIAGHKIDRSRLAWMCKEAENDFVGVSCGIMDQYVIALGKRNHAMKLDCRTMNYEQVPLPRGARLLVVHSGVQHSLSDGDYNSRQRECQQAVELLNRIYPDVSALRDVSVEQLQLQRAVLGEVLYHRSRHVVTEIQRVRDAHGAMVTNDRERLGQLMSASHDSLQNDYEVSCDEVNALVGIARSCSGVYGSRMVGAGFGGCTVSLIETGVADRVVEEITGRYEEVLGQPPWYQLVEAADPVSELPLP
jgi:galactokinase